MGHCFSIVLCKNSVVIGYFFVFLPSMAGDRLLSVKNRVHIVFFDCFLLFLAVNSDMGCLAACLRLFF